MHTTRLIIVPLAAAALAAPAAASAQPVDLRSPDARDAAPTSSLAGTTSQDLRGPDARDAAGPGVIHSAPRPIAVASPTPSSPSGDATPWLTVALGGTAAGAVAAAGFTYRRRRSLSVR
jgi:hypothetical protein